MNLEIKNRDNIIHQIANFINVLSLALNMYKGIKKDTRIISSGVAHKSGCDFEYICTIGTTLFK